MKAGIATATQFRLLYVVRTRAERGSSVVARLVGIVHQHENHGERALPRPIEVVQIVLIEDLDLDRLRIGNGALNDDDNFLLVESIDPRSVQRQQLGLPLAKVCREEGSACKRRPSRIL